MSDFKAMFRAAASQRGASVRARVRFPALCAAARRSFASTFAAAGLLTAAHLLACRRPRSS